MTLNNIHIYTVHIFTHTSFDTSTPPPSSLFFLFLFLSSPLTHLSLQLSLSLYTSTSTSPWSVSTFIHHFTLHPPPNLIHFIIIIIIFTLRLHIIIIHPLAPRTTQLTPSSRHKLYIFSFFLFPVIHSSTPPLVHPILSSRLFASS